MIVNTHRMCSHLWSLYSSQQVVPRQHRHFFTIQFCIYFRLVSLKLGFCVRFTSSFAEGWASRLKVLICRLLAFLMFSFHCFDQLSVLIFSALTFCTGCNLWLGLQFYFWLCIMFLAFLLLTNMVSFVLVLYKVQTQIVFCELLKFKMLLFLLLLTCLIKPVVKNK